MPPTAIRPATGPLDLDAVRALWREYWSAYGLDPGFQGFAEEVASLPDAYTLILLAHQDAGPVATIALRPLDRTCCEAKRLYVRPAARGQGLGRALLKAVIDAARRQGYRELYGDTLPVMQSALGLYRELGFEPVGRYSSTPTPGAIYLRLTL
jgi:putative acetyltransferase